jgi:hypothetical protein
MEKRIGKNRSFSSLLEDWRCLCRVKIDSLHEMAEIALYQNKEIVIAGNMMLEFVEKFQARKITPHSLEDLYIVEQEKCAKNLMTTSTKLSDRFQNIHIVQLAKLAEGQTKNYAKNFSNIHRPKTVQFLAILSG